MCYIDICKWTRDDSTNRETTEGPGSRERNNLVRIIVGVKRADKRTFIK